MPDSEGNAAQVRIVAEQVADAAITRFAQKHPEVSKSDIPPPLKWAGAIIAALFTMGIGGMAVWLVTTVNEMQVTLARMDERMANQSTTQEGQLDEMGRRVTRLESYHGGG